MHDLHTLLASLQTQPHCLMPLYASALEAKIEQCLAGNVEVPEQKLTNGTLIKDGVAVINIEGIIAKRVGLPQEILEILGIVDLDNVDAQLRAVQADPNVKAVVLDVTSPGGFSAGVVSTAQIVNEIAQDREVVVYSSLLNASAAYWISSQASSIITSIDAEIGSIGVYHVIQDWSKALENEGVKVHLIKAGRYKALGHPSQALTDEQKAFVQSEVDKTCQAFTGAVLSKRTVSADDMQGQTFSGVEAVEKNLADGIASSLDEVIEALKSE